MASSLVVVESPTKVKTIKKFLGNDFNVVASMGHIKDLPKSVLGIDLENNFEPTYKAIETKKKTIDELKKAAKSAENIYLAPDPDREGEAIAWHISEVVDVKNKNVYRVLFNDLTKKTVLEAIENPSELDFNKYEAQQTRRILDRLVGYQISPILWDKVKRGLSAGRVQSVAVRMICERENEINKFIPEEYWNLLAQFEGENPPPFEAKLIKIDGKKAKVVSGEQANLLADTLKKSSFIVERLSKSALSLDFPIFNEITVPFLILSAMSTEPPEKKMVSLMIGSPDPTPLMYFFITEVAEVNPGRNAFSLSAMPGPWSEIII